MICEICGESLCFRWSDTHGVGVCVRCGCPYRIYHYGEDGKRICEKPPELALSAKGVRIAKQYWQETQRRVFPACYDMGFTERCETSYSGATRDDCEAFDAWYRANVRKDNEASA